MPRSRRTENKGLPARWQRHHGAYYYQVPPGMEAAWDGKKRFRLGGTLPEAYKAWAERLQEPVADELGTIGQLLARYGLEVVPTKSPKTQADNVRAIVRLTRLFGKLKLTELRPKDVYKYVDKRGKVVKDGREERMVPAKTAAHREIEVLSHAFTKAVEWGAIDAHPFKDQVRLDGARAEAPRSRYVEDWEIVECLALAPFRKRGSVRAIQAYIRVKLLTGMARSDLLRLTMSSLKQDGIHIQRHKTAHSSGKKTIYQWTDDLRAAVKMAKEARPRDLSPFLFCNSAGEGYFDEKTGEAGGWKSMWQRFVDRVLSETKVQERFTEHDLRAKCASDAESLEKARALLSHADARTTQRFYRRKPELVEPPKSRFE